MRSRAPSRRRCAQLRRAAAAASGALLLAACVPSLGPLRLPAATGAVVDATSGEPVADAEVIEWWRGSGRMGGPQPVYHARWSTTGPEGDFAFPSALAPSPRIWVLRTYGPAYSIYHPDYGLQHAGVRENPPLLLRLDRAAAAQGAAELAALCREADDAGSRHLAGLACPARPERDPAR